MDWFDKNAAALISAGAALSAAIIVGVFNLLNNINNHKHDENKAARDEAKDTKKLYLEKGEELHGLLTKWGNITHVSFMYDDAFINGQITIDQQSEALAKTMDFDTFMRLNSLVNIYFPYLLPDFEKARLSGIETANVIESLRKNDISILEASIQNRKNTDLFHRSLESVLSDLQSDLLHKMNS